MSRSNSRLAARDSRLAERLRPERGATSLRQGYGGPPKLQRRRKPPSESAWGWGPTRSDKCGPSRFKTLIVLSLCLIGGGACRQDMHNQPKYRGLRASTFFADGSSARPLVEGTIARGTLQDDEAFFTGKIDKVAVKEFPFAVDEALLNRGQERYNIYCSPCHDKAGTGNGMVIQRGFKRQPPSYHIDRLRQADVGYFFDVITNGFGAMPDYKAQIAPRDRWAIVAYIRALQLSQRAAASDVPGGDPSKVPQPAGGGEHAPGKN